MVQGVVAAANLWARGPAERLPIEARERLPRGLFRYLVHLIGPSSLGRELPRRLRVAAQRRPPASALYEGRRLAAPWSFGCQLSGNP